MMGKGFVALVGAGPGDPGLITVKALEYIKRADAIVYDRLVNPDLLDHAPQSCELVYVGKTPKHHTKTQDEINEILVAEAQKGKLVVRLKGGDPFLFGRGGEEAEVLAENGIPFEVVPGVTSAIAAPAYAGIPVTHRDLSSSVVIVTGHEDPEKSRASVDWDALAQGPDTIVVLMGLGNLASIADRLIKAGKPPDTPVALIQDATTPDQKTITGTLADIVQRASEAGLRPPAVAVIGQGGRTQTRKFRGTRPGPSQANASSSPAPESRPAPCPSGSPPSAQMSLNSPPSKSPSPTNTRRPSKPRWPVSPNTTGLSSPALTV